MPEGPPRCPFYGFHWPADGSHLFRGRPGECGLDLSERGLCQMEARKERVDFERCEVRGRLDHLLHAGKRYIRFYSPELPAEGVPLDVWTDRVFRGK